MGWPEDHLGELSLGTLRKGPSGPHVPGSEGLTSRDSAKETERSVIPGGGSLGSHLREAGVTPGGEEAGGLPGGKREKGARGGCVVGGRPGGENPQPGSRAGNSSRLGCASVPGKPRLGQTAKDGDAVSTSSGFLGTRADSGPWGPGGGGPNACPGGLQGSVEGGRAEPEEGASGTQLPQTSRPVTRTRGRGTSHKPHSPGRAGPSGSPSGPCQQLPGTVARLRLAVQSGNPVSSSWKPRVLASPASLLFQDPPLSTAIGIRSCGLGR